MNQMIHYSSPNLIHPVKRYTCILNSSECNVLHGCIQCSEITYPFVQVHTNVSKPVHVSTKPYLLCMLGGEE